MLETLLYYQDGHTKRVYVTLHTYPSKRVYLVYSSFTYISQVSNVHQGAIIYYQEVEVSKMGEVEDFILGKKC